MSAPPTPWTKRAPISISWLCATAQSSEAAVKTAEADQEDSPLADQVAEPAGEQQQAAERDQVGVDDPGEVALGEAEVVLDRRQRDVHDRRVEDDHQHARAEHVERDPARAVVRSVGGRSAVMRGLLRWRESSERSTWLEKPT